MAEPPPSFFPQPDPDSRLGPVAGARLFDRFRLEACAGRGGHGVVWRAWDEVLGDRVALKLIHPALATDPAALEELRGEARRCRRLSHPHIVRLYDFHQGADGAALAMEWVDGRSLSAERAACMASAAGLLDPAAIAPWLGGLAAALDYAHTEAGVIHRDLKPANVLLTREGSARIVDFGVSCRLTETATRTTRLLTSGTLAYMSPQQLLGEEPSPADDRYSLGATLYELVCGRPPFTGGDLSLQIRERLPVLPSLARRRTAEAAGVSVPPLPPAWDEWLLACLDKTPAARPGTALEISAGLVRAAEGRGRGFPPPRWLRRWRSLPADRRRTTATLGLGATGAVMIALVGLGLRVTSPGPEANSPNLAPVAATPSATSIESPPGPWRVRGSMAEGLVVHLPLDGEFKDESGYLRQARPLGTTWTPDRAERPDMALALGGLSVLELPLADEFTLAPGQPFTLTAWVRPEDLRDARLLGLEPVEGGEFKVSVGFHAGRLVADIGAEREWIVAARAEWPDAGGEWHPLALVFDGHRLDLVLDGTRVASIAWERPAKRARRVRLLVGRNSEDNENSVVGTIDDIRLYRRALSEDALASLALESVVANPSPVVLGPLPGPDPTLPWEKPYAWGLTTRRVGAADDWATTVATEFGPLARVADWAELSPAWSTWPQLAAELAGWSTKQSVFVTRGGQKTFFDGRTYNASRMDGTVQVGYLAHEALPGHAITLGSWYDQRLPVLAHGPTELFWRHTRFPPDPAGWSLELPPPSRSTTTAAPAGVSSATRHALALRLPRNATGAALTLTDHQGGSRELRWALTGVSPEGDATARLSISAAANSAEQPVLRDTLWHRGDAAVLVVVAAEGRLFVGTLTPASRQMPQAATLLGLHVLPGGLHRLTLAPPPPGEDAPALDWLEIR